MKVVECEVVMKGVKVGVRVVFHDGDVGASRDGVDVVSVLSKSSVRIGGGRNVMHVEVEEDG